MMKLYLPEEAAEQLRVSTRTIFEWLRTGKLKGVKAGRQWRIREPDLEAFLVEPVPVTGHQTAEDTPHEQL